MFVPLCREIFGFEGRGKTEYIGKRLDVLIKVEIVEDVDLSMGESGLDAFLQ